MLGAVQRGGAESELISPSVGVFTSTVAVGELVSPGQVVGAIEVLGVKHALRVPEGVAGRVMSRAAEGRTRAPVQYGDPLFTITKDARVEASTSNPAVVLADESELSFLSPMSGRFYGRSSPTDTAFVNDGDTVRKGQTIGLLEVMKTFNRLVYQGDRLPDQAIVQRVAPNDGDDVVRGDVILALQPFDENSSP